MHGKSRRRSAVAPQAGFEPATYRLTADRSTTELLRSVENALEGRRRRLSGDSLRLK